MIRYFKILNGGHVVDQCTELKTVSIDVESDLMYLGLYNSIYPEIKSNIDEISSKTVGLSHYIRVIGIEDGLIMLDYGSHSNFIYIKEVDSNGKPILSKWQSSQVC